jgi:hypothetical protein
VGLQAFVKPPATKSEDGSVSDTDNIASTAADAGDARSVVSDDYLHPIVVEEVPQSSAPPALPETVVENALPETAVENIETPASEI